jgi:hypothetical protein
LDGKNRNFLAQRLSKTTLIRKIVDCYHNFTLVRSYEFEFSNSDLVPEREKIVSMVKELLLRDGITELSLNDFIFPIREG